MNRGFISRRLTNFSPRVGFAFDPSGTGKQSLRASYTLTFEAPELYYDSGFPANAPYASAQSLTLDNSTNAADTVKSFDNPWKKIAGGNPFPTQYPPSSTVAFPRAISPRRFILQICAALTCISTTPATNIRILPIGFFRSFKSERALFTCGAFSHITMQPRCQLPRGLLLRRTTRRSVTFSIALQSLTVQLQARATPPSAPLPITAWLISMVSSSPRITD